MLVFQTPSASEGIQTEVHSGISLKNENGLVVPGCAVLRVFRAGTEIVGAQVFGVDAPARDLQLKLNSTGMAEADFFRKTPANERLRPSNLGAMEGEAMKKTGHQVLHFKIRADRGPDRILPPAPRRCGRSAAPSG